MSFKSYNGILRKVGRKIVLPVEEIKSILNKELFDKEQLDICVDFGAGTLFWSEWLQSKGINTYAVDTIYNEEKTVNGITCIDSMEKLDMLKMYSGGGYFLQAMFYTI